MISKVVIAAAGQGTRMKHLTRHKSKHLIEVQKRPFLAYLLDNLLKAGYREIILVVGFKAEKVEEFVKKYKPPRAIKFKTAFVNQFEILGPKKKEYGTLCPIKCVKSLVGKENFVAIYGDNLYSVRDLRAMRTENKYNYVAGLEHKKPEKYGVLVVDEKGLLIKIVEKPKEYVGNLINTGLYKFTSEIFEEVPKVKLSPRGEYELTDAITFLAKKKKVKVKQIQDHWLDFGNPGDIIKFSRFLKKCQKI